MPCLNQDILFEIGQKLIEDGNQTSVIQFGLSGKECMSALRTVFSSFSTLKLYYGYYIAGWGEKTTCFEFNDYPHVKSLMRCIGRSVLELLIEYPAHHEEFFFQLIPVKNVYQDLYQPILHRIIAERKLINLSVTKKYADTEYEPYFKNFMSNFSQTLKDLQIPSCLMDEHFRDNFKLDSLIVLDESKKAFLYCCETDAFGLKESFFYSYNLVKHFDDVSRFLSNVPQLTLNNVLENVSSVAVMTDYFTLLLKHFSSMEHLKIDFKEIGVTNQKAKRIARPAGLFIYYMYVYVRSLENVLVSTHHKNISRVTCFINKYSVTKFKSSLSSHSFEDVVQSCKRVCEGFKVVDSNPEYCCLQRKFYSAANGREIVMDVEVSE